MEVGFGVCVVEGRAKGEGGSRREEEDLVLGFVLGLMLVLGLVSGFLPLHLEQIKHG
jgi:hypothetical protein